jgi:signal transduction histidine kinase
VDLLVAGVLLDDVEAVVREGLSNAARHAQATSVTVSITIEPTAASPASSSAVVVRVTDDGLGLGGDGPRAASGIANLAARAASHGGSSELTPGAEHGAVLTWRAPLPEPSKDSSR